MARITTNFTNALDEYLSTISKISSRTEAVCKKAVYKGAQVVANQVREELYTVPTDERWGVTDKKKIGPTKAEKKDIIGGFGVSPIEKREGQINASVGFEGAMYNDDGKPIQMLARAVNSGTSFMHKNPFFEKAARKSRSKAKKIMIETAEAELQKIVKQEGK